MVCVWTIILIKNVARITLIFSWYHLSGNILYASVPLYIFCIPDCISKLSSQGETVSFKCDRMRHWKYKSSILHSFQFELLVTLAFMYLHRVSFRPVIWLSNSEMLWTVNELLEQCKTPTSQKHSLLCMAVWHPAITQSVKRWHKISLITPNPSLYCPHTAFH